MADHVWFHEHIAAYCADGLTADERGRFTQHRADCSSCALALDEWSGLDQAMDKLFAEVRPSAGLESRVIEKLRVASKGRRLRWTLPAKWVAGVAAVVMIGVLGAAVQTVMENGFLESAPLALQGKVREASAAPSNDHHKRHRIQAENNLKQIGLGIHNFDGDIGERFRYSTTWSDQAKDTPLMIDGTASTVQHGLRGWDSSGAAKRLDDLDGAAAGEDKSWFRRNATHEPLDPGSESKTTTWAVPVAPAPTTAAGLMPTSNMPGPVAGGGSAPGGGGGFSNKAPGMGPTEPGSSQHLAGPVASTPTVRGFAAPMAKADNTYFDRAPEKGDGKVETAKESPAGDGKPGDDRGEGKDISKASGKQQAKENRLDQLALLQVPDSGAKLPQVAQRKIIRTGDIEFEVNAFDDAIAEITKLITAIPGAFVATVNSEKLPNGKVRGSIVVRVPPENLDKFVLDMRRDLTKSGELKSQRIGSQDVTKQYTDIESRLRAARAMEERLISIIKTGKGEIKDLLAAERELGVWRTKIEEMEGEIRYYNNQTSLSTLTITAVEKEIRVAAAIVISEQVNMKIETDDVVKAQKAALQAVTDAKGRITKSDLKQHTAGQFEAILLFEVAPKEADPMIEKLKALGVVASLDSQRLQQAEGGSAAVGETIKTRQSDVRFSIALYNLANIKPRETFELKIAVANVPADFRKMQDAVQKAKGQVRVSQLNEQNQSNLNAQFEFDVLTPQREDIDKVLAELGDVFSRNTARAGVNEVFTERKVGYRLSLWSATSIPPRETQTLQTIAVDVPDTYQKLQDAVAKAKGFVRNGHVTEQDRLNITAQFDFDVPIAERGAIEKLVAANSDVYSRSTTRLQPTEVATDRKVGYKLTIRGAIGIPARETYTLQAVSLDVPEGFRKLQDTVVKAKGHIRTAQLNEQDKLNISAQFDFDIPTSEREAFEKLLGEVSDVYSRNTARVAPTEMATDRKLGYRLTVKNVAGMPAREKVDLVIEVKDAEKAATRLKEAVKLAQGTVIGERFILEANGRMIALMAFDLPLTAKDDVLQKFKAVGIVRLSQPTQNLQAPDTKLALAQINVRLTTEGPIVPSDEGLWPPVRKSLSTSFMLLSHSLGFVILGVSVILPWALILWLAVKAYRRFRGKTEASVAA